MGRLETSGAGTFLLDSALKSQQWERAKGELRALVAICGSYSDGIPSHMKTEPDNWQVLEKRIDEFVKSVEDDGLTD